MYVSKGNIHDPPQIVSTGDFIQSKQVREFVTSPYPFEQLYIHFIESAWGGAEEKRVQCGGEKGDEGRKKGQRIEGKR